MLQLISTTSTALIKIITALVGITESVDNVVASANHATKALRSTAEQLELDADFSSLQRKAERVELTAIFNKSIEELEEDE